MNRFKITEYSYILYGFFPPLFLRGTCALLCFFYVYTTYPLAIQRSKSSIIRRIIWF